MLFVRYACSLVMASKMALWQSWEYSSHSTIAGHYSSITVTLYAHAVALFGGPAGLKLCGPDSRPKPLNLRRWNGHAVRS